MKRQSVESSNLTSEGYDKESQILEVQFNHGGVYQYFEVPKNVYEALMNAGSHGKYFAHNIMDDYEYQKM